MLSNLSIKMLQQLSKLKKKTLHMSSLEKLWRKHLSKMLPSSVLKMIFMRPIKCMLKRFLQNYSLSQPKKLSKIVIKLKIKKPKMIAKVSTWTKSNLLKRAF